MIGSVSDRAASRARVRVARWNAVCTGAGITCYVLGLVLIGAGRVAAVAPLAGIPVLGIGSVFFTVHLVLDRDSRESHHRRSRA